MWPSESMTLYTRPITQLLSGQWRGPGAKRSFGFPGRYVGERRLSTRTDAMPGGRRSAGPATTMLVLGGFRTPALSTGGSIINGPVSETLHMTCRRRRSWRRSRLGRKPTIEHPPQLCNGATPRSQIQFAWLGWQLHHFGHRITKDDPRRPTSARLPVHAQRQSGIW
jgi:hypothetical protein